MCHTLRGSWYIKATNLYTKYGCMNDSVLLGYEAVSMSNQLATFRGNVMSSSWSVKTSRNVRSSWTLRSFMICIIRCLEASESAHSGPRSHISEMNPQPHPLPNPLNSRGCMKFVHADDDSRITQTFQAQLASNGTILACNRCRTSCCLRNLYEALKQLQLLQHSVPDYQFSKYKQKLDIKLKSPTNMPTVAYFINWDHTHTNDQIPVMFTIK